MNLLRRFLENHVLANLTFGLVIILGILAYQEMPRARDPEINFNWIDITTALPGASSIDVEKRVTDPIEDTISSTVRDLRFVTSTSREGVSSILVRFNQLSKTEFRERVADLRREVQNVYTDQLPDEALDPQIREITSSSGFPTASLVLTAQSPDEAFRRYAADLKLALERQPGVDEVLKMGSEDPELRIAFYPEKLLGLAINPNDLADTVRAYFSDVAIGDMNTANGRWLVRLEGTSSSLDELEAFPVVTAQGVVPLGSLAEIYRSSAEPSILAHYQGQPAIMFNITKQEQANTLQLLDNLNQFIERQQAVVIPQGYHLALVDDQTISTRDAIRTMQWNAGIGLSLVILVVFIFLGGRIALLTGIGIPFTLAATFFILHAMGMSLNNTVLLGVVIALGMLVDDAVVVVETIYYRLQQGGSAMEAAMAALQEVAAPVFTSVLTTIAAFLPLMLLPGIMGDFLRVIPMVVCIALAVSLLEAFWMLPAHVSVMRVNFDKTSALQRKRQHFSRNIRHYYSLLLIRVMRHPVRSLLGIVGVAALAVLLLVGGVINVNFFAADPYRLLYINAESPARYTIDDSMAVAEQLERKALAVLEPEEVRATVAYSGIMFTQTEPYFGENYSQAFISLNPIRGDMRDTYSLIAAVEDAVGEQLGESKVSVLVLEDGPPVGQPVSVKVRGDRFEDIQAVVDKISAHLQADPRFKNINTDFKTGSPQLKLTLDGDAIQRAGIAPQVVTAALQSRVDGLLIGRYQNLGEEVDIRLLARTGSEDNLDALLSTTLTTANGGTVRLSTLLQAEYGSGYQNIRHYNFKRSITINGDIDETQLDAVAANDLIRAYWDTIRAQHPGISLDFSGVLDDIEENLSGISMLFAMGLGLIYLILGTQFKSYLQPLMILVSVPLAFIGVVFGLVLTNNPLSFTSMYGVVALSGISVNSAIVLISAANSRLKSGMSPLHATIYAGRRRVVPILITSTTTIAGLFSLALGIGGKSLLWGPIAATIVSGLLFSTVLVLVVIPLIYYASVRRQPVVLS
ncbi:MULTISPECIES: efflux RND transporter permease subunit [unclassified Ketobacter]|uniref:efflux RND transporter permease subunit n=1 Tax=unclassified Ketobacter TaxID=2639109 RepID=UPI000F2CDA45|nr:MULTISPECIES: efflux RND transporter permease subunit [unclassified Ketobacter]RLT88392.1 MAG: efflux RND transporter permease subunit [Ketobacter sp. GenoA1]RLT95533.1 MAG: efflux RND transporter permease subunit [Ketobacter sp.]